METASAYDGHGVAATGAGHARRRFTACARYPARTLRDIIAEAPQERRPGLRFSLCLETGELRPFVNVYVNGTHVRYLQWLDTPLPPGAVVTSCPRSPPGDEQRDFCASTVVKVHACPA